METNHKEILIERYLNDELSLTERQSFESEIHTDTGLASEVEFQKLVINGIKKYRVNQLKSQLSTVDVTPSVFETTGFKIVSSLLFVGSVVSGILYFSTQPEKVDKSETVWFNTDLFKPDQPQIITFPVDKISAIEPAKQPVKTTFSKEKSSSDVVKTDKKKEKEKNNNAIVAVVPQVQLSEDEYLTNSFIQQETFPEMVNVSQKSIPAIVLTDEKSKELRYKYTNGHLSLYGDFSASPYEILEINNAKGKQVYLYHLNSYYQIDPVNEVRALIPISNTEKIEELKLVQKNK